MTDVEETIWTLKQIIAKLEKQPGNAQCRLAAWGHLSVLEGNVWVDDEGTGVFE